MQDRRLRANLYGSATNSPMARKKAATENPVEPVETDPMSVEAVTTETETTVTTEAAQSPKATKNITRTSGERKVGQELLDCLKENDGLPIEELAIKAGYFTRTVNNETGETSTTPHKQELFKATTEASTGLTFVSAKRSYTTRKGRAPVITVGKLGNCVVGARHSTIAGFEAGSKVQVFSEAGRIVLTQLEGDAPADAEVEVDDADQDIADVQDDLDY